MSESRRAVVVWDATTGGSLTLASSDVVIGTPLVPASRQEGEATPPGRITAEELFAGAQAACFSIAFEAAVRARGASAPGFSVEVVSAWEPEGPVLPPAAVYVVLETQDVPDDVLRGSVADAREACGLRAGDRVFLRREGQDHDLGASDVPDEPGDERG